MDSSHSLLGFSPIWGKLIALAHGASRRIVLSIGINIGDIIIIIDGSIVRARLGFASLAPPTSRFTTSCRWLVVGHDELAGEPFRWIAEQTAYHQ